MTLILTLGAAALALATTSPPVQTIPAPTPTAPATAVPDAAASQADPAAPASEEAPALTDAEQKTLAKCAKMEPQQQAQSSKCGAVMAKAGETDPSKAIPTSPRQN